MLGISLSTIPECLVSSCLPCPECTSPCICIPNLSAWYLLVPADEPGVVDFAHVEVDPQAYGNKVGEQQDKPWKRTFILLQYYKDLDDQWEQQNNPRKRTSVVSEEQVQGEQQDKSWQELLYLSCWIKWTWRCKGTRDPRSPWVRPWGLTRPSSRWTAPAPTTIRLFSLILLYL